MQFCDFQYVPSAHDYKHWYLAYCHGCNKWILLWLHRNSRIRLTPWSMQLDNMAVYRCLELSKEWHCNLTELYWGAVLPNNKFNSCHPNLRHQCSRRFGTPDNSNYKVLDNEKVVRIKTQIQRFTHSNSRLQCTPPWFHVDWGYASSTAGFDKSIYIAMYTKSMIHIYIISSTCLSSFGRYQKLNWPFLPMKQSMANEYDSVLFDHQITGRDISADACPWSREAFQISPKLNIKWYTSSVASDIKVPSIVDSYHNFAILFCPVCCQVTHLMCLLVKGLLDHVDVVSWYVDIANNDWIDIQFKF